MAQWFDIATPTGTANVQSLMSSFGLDYNPNDPFVSLYQRAIDSARPYGGQSPYQKGGNWDVWAQAALRGRTLIFAETKIGDCLLHAVAGVSGGQVAAEDVIGIAGSALPVPGIGALAAGITGNLLQHHAVAVATETNTLCALTGELAPQVEQIYQALYSSSITTAQAVSYMKAVAAEFHNAYASAGVAVKNCNDGCGMDAILAAHVNLVRLLPAQDIVASVPTSTAISNTNTDPVSVGAYPYSPVAQIPQAALSGYTPTLFGGISPMWLIIGLVVLLILVLK